MASQEIIKSFGERGRAGRGAGAPGPHPGPRRGPGHRPDQAKADPALLLWVHAALVDSAVAVRGMFGTPLSPEDNGKWYIPVIDQWFG